MPINYAADAIVQSKTKFDFGTLPANVFPCTRKIEDSVRLPCSIRPYMFSFAQGGTVLTAVISLVN